MLDRLNLEEMRTQGTRWKKARGALRALWIALGVVAVFILVIQTAATAQPPLTRNQEQTKDLILLILLIAFFILVIVAYLPIWAYNRNAARIKVQIAADLARQFPEFIDPKNAKDLPSYAKSAASLNGGKNGKTLSQSLTSHDYTGAEAIIEQNKDGFPYPDVTVPQAHLYHMRGEYEQADTLYWRLLAGTMRRGSPAYVAVILSNLADTHLERKRLSEALLLIEHAIPLAPNYYLPYLVLCDYYLNLPGNPHPARAVQWAEVARDVLPSRLSVPQNQFYQAILALYACTLANAGELDRARAVIAELLPYMDTLSQTNLDAFFRVGRVLAITGDASSARGIFEKVAAQDAQGALGKLAAERLEEQT